MDRGKCVPGVVSVDPRSVERCSINYLPAVWPSPRSLTPCLTYGLFAVIVSFSIHYLSSIGILTAFASLDSS
jgi:hypothetical protein